MMADSEPNSILKVDYKALASADQNLSFQTTGGNIRQGGGEYVGGPQEKWHGAVSTFVGADSTLTSRRVPDRGAFGIVDAGAEALLRCRVRSIATGM